MSAKPRFGLGWKPNERDDSHGEYKAIFSAEPYLLRTPDMRAIARDRSLNGYHLNQGGAGSCWGFATARNLQCFYGVRGVSAPLASPRFMYWNGRNEEYANLPPIPNRALDDDGTQPRLGLRALADLGFVSWDDCPYSDDSIDIKLRPNDSAYALAFSQRGLTYANIPQLGRARVDAVADSLRKGFPVQIGMRIDEAFMNWGGTGKISSIDANHIVGGHMMSPLFVDYNYETVWLENQWMLDGSTPWGTRGEFPGMAVVSFTVFGSQFVSDVSAIKFAPELKRIVA